MPVLCISQSESQQTPPGNRGNFIFRNYSDSALQFPITKLYFTHQTRVWHTTQHTQGDRTMRTISLGNNEAVSSGITVNSDGTFTAMTFTASKTFKTLKGAQKWLAIRLSK